jgi:hypothetical protein
MDLLTAFPQTCFLFNLIAVGALLTGSAMSQTPAPPPDTLITLQRGACEKRCAVYRLVIFADGTVIYEGRFNVRRTGLIKSGVPPEALIKLVQNLEAAGLYDLEANYGYGNRDHCASWNSDGPAAIVSLASGGRSKTVLHDHRCISPVSQRLSEMEDWIDQAVGVAKWIR